MTKKSCSNEILKCESTGCYTIEPDVSSYYSWWSEKVLTKAKCSFNQVQVTANDQNDPIFNTDPTKCRASDGYCKYTDSIIVWEPDKIIHGCPYEIIDQLDFKRVEGNIMQAVTQPLAFQITNKKLICNPNSFYIYSTVEGLFLAKSNEMKNPEVVKANTQISTQNLLILADNDNNRIEQIKVYKEMNLRHCFQLMNTLELITI